jgi:hypothetical protein
MVIPISPKKKTNTIYSKGNTMGANLDSRTFLTDDKGVIKTKWDEEVSHSQYQDGCSYSGCIGMLDGSIEWVNRGPFNSQDEALEHISENHRKWSGPMAVPFKIKGGKKVPAYVKKANEKYETAKDQRQVLEAKAKQDFHNAKSQFVTCKGCKSKLNRSHLHTTFCSTICPLCSQNLLSATVLQRVKKAEQKIKDTCIALGEARVKAREQNATGKIGYVVGGICSS